MGGFVGAARVEQEGRVVDTLRDGQFSGGIPFISEAVAPANVVALEETWYMSWPKDRLKAFLADKPSLNNALQLTLGFDLSQRLLATYARAG